MAGGTEGEMAGTPEAKKHGGPEGRMIGRMCDQRGRAGRRVCVQRPFQPETIVSHLKRRAALHLVYLSVMLVAANRNITAGL